MLFRLVIESVNIKITLKLKGYLLNIYKKKGIDYVLYLCLFKRCIQKDIERTSISNSIISYILNKEYHIQTKVLRKNNEIPYFSNCDKNISISYHNRLLAFCLSDYRIGLDVEYTYFDKNLDYYDFFFIKMN